MSASIFSFFEKIIYVIFFTVIALIVGINVLETRGHHSISAVSSTYFELTTLVISLILIGALIGFRKNITNLLEKIPTAVWTVGLLGLSLILQLIVVKLFAVKPSWDFGALVNGAKLYLETGEVFDYFSIYPNNIFLFCILVVTGKVFTPDLSVYILFNVFIIIVSQYLIFLIASKAAGRLVGMISLAVSVLFFPYIFFAPVVYTDTISLIFLLLPLYLMLDKNGELKTDMPNILLASFIFSLGMLLKGSLIIFIIAFSITFLLYMKGWKKAYIILPFIMLFVVKTVFSTALYQLNILDKEQQMQTSFPISHWLVMAQNSERAGKYSADDVVWTKQLLSTQPREKVSHIHFEELQHRLEEKGLLGNLKFNLEKITHTWTDGTYYSLNKIKRNPIEPINITSLLDYKSGEILQGFARIQHLILFIGLLLAFPLIKDRKALVTFCMLSIIGYFFFFLFWETRSRYLVSVTPLVILLSCMSYFKIKFRRSIG